MLTSNRQSIYLPRREKRDKEKLKRWSHSCYVSCQRWNSWTAFLVEESGHKLESSHTQVFVWFSTLIYPFYKMLFTNRSKFSFSQIFVYVFFKPEKSLVFFKNLLVERLWIAWSKRLESFFKLMTKKSVSGAQSNDNKKSVVFGYILVPCTESSTGKDYGV